MLVVDVEGTRDYAIEERFRLAAAITGAASGIGMRIRATAELESFDGRFYTMRVRAWDETNEIGSGTVNRAFVSVARFMARVKSKTA